MSNLTINTKIKIKSQRNLLKLHGYGSNSLNQILQTIIVSIDNRNLMYFNFASVNFAYLFFQFLIVYCEKN